MRYQLFTPEPDNGVTGNPGDYQPVLKDCQVQQVALGKYHCGTCEARRILDRGSTDSQVLASTPRIFTYIRVHDHLVKY
jgi:hypothetical protein